MANSDNKINIGDSWKDVDSMQINVGDSWKDIDEAYINIGDSWKQFYSSLVPGFKTIIYTGDGGSNRSITGVGFQPDLVWIKRRTNTVGHVLTDSVRGVTLELKSNIDNNETMETDGLKSFDSDGFTLGNDNNYNTVVEPYVAWCWKADIEGYSDNGDGKPQDESYSKDSGLSIITYEGSTQNRAIKHSLGAAPKIVICKQRTNPDESWAVYSSELGNDQLLSLDTNSPSWLDNCWDTTTPDSTKIYLSGFDSQVNYPNEDYVCYAFSEVSGLSNFGSYIGNSNSNGPIVTCGFKPSMLIIKNASTSGDWVMIDSIRDGQDIVNQALLANGNDAENANDKYKVEFTSTGFQIQNYDSDINGYPNKYIYMAFA